MNSYSRYKYSLIQNALLALILLFCFLFSIYELELSWFNTHMSRDLFRSWQWLEFKPDSWFGPEMGWDIKRLPGPFYYWLVGLFSLAGNVKTILLLKLAFVYLVLALLVFEIKQTYSYKLALNFCLLFCLMPVFFFTNRNLWNPSLIVAINLLQLYFFLKFTQKQHNKWLGVSFVLMLMGIQIHFSTILSYLAISISSFLFSSFKTKKIISLQIIVLGFLMFVWAFLNPSNQFQEQLENFYGYSNYLSNRLNDIGYHLHFSLLALPDYDLFGLFSNILTDTHSWNSNLVWYFSNAGQYIIAVMLMASLVVLIKKPNLISVFLILQILFFVISIAVLKNKPHLPYRYGLCLYPIQFFIVAYAFDLYFSEQLKKFFMGFCLFVFFGNIYINSKMLEAYKISQRAPHTNEDTLELNLKNKLALYSRLKDTESFNLLTYSSSLYTDPFQYYHGRAINKFRLKEMNWQQDQIYFSLFKTVFNKPISISEDLINHDTGTSLLVQLPNIKDLQSDETLIKFSTLEVKNLPQNIKLIYLDTDKKEIYEKPWENSNLILPMAFINSVENIKYIRLEFDINSDTKENYLNLLLDDNARFNFAYKPIYKLRFIQINRENVSVVKAFEGNFLVQNQYIYKLNSKNNKINLELEIIYNKNNFSRIDIFTSNVLLENEQLY